MTEPYYADDTVRLYLGDCREVLPALGEEFDAAVCDPPYGFTILSWDEWPTGWTQAVAAVTSSMWCFGSLRMFMAKAPEFAWSNWHLSHDVVWEKHNGTGFAADRFKGVHELVAHWYRGAWSKVHHDVPCTAYTGPDKHARARRSRTPHTGSIGAHIYADDGTRLARSIQRHPSVRGGLHPTEKPVAVLTPLIEYAVPPAVSVLKCVECGHEPDADLQVVRRTVPEQTEQSTEAVLQSRLQVRSTAQPAPGLPGLWHPVQSASARHEPRQQTDMLGEVRQPTEEAAAEDLRDMPAAVSAGQTEQSVLLEGMRSEGDWISEEARGRDADPEGVPEALPTRAPDGEQVRLRPRASDRDGRDVRADAHPSGSRSSPQRDQGRQPAGEPRATFKTESRPAAPAAREADSVSALSGHDRRLGTCPHCGGALALTNRPSGVLLDPMAGSCSTAVAARLSGRRAVCIEAHEPYAEAAARRLDQGVLTFDGTEAS
jgi:site-specific DNA-methyltransferase (adenine-specific)